VEISAIFLKKFAQKKVIGIPITTNRQLDYD